MARGEVAGGRWNEDRGSSEDKPRAARAPPLVNFRSVLRRSTVALRLAIRGWSERRCADVLGHDEHMIRTVIAGCRCGCAGEDPGDRASSRHARRHALTFRAKVLGLGPARARAPLNRPSSNGFEQEKGSLMEMPARSAPLWLKPGRRT
jgi:hypothetical protein